MDRQQKYLLSLYGESTPPEHPDGSRFKDPDGEALREMKQLLDERPRMSPPDHLVRDVLAMARYDSAGSTTRGDRAPVARKRRAPAYAAAFSTMLVLIAVGLFVLLNPVEETDIRDISVADVLPTPGQTPFPAEPSEEPARNGTEYDEQRAVPSPSPRREERTPRQNYSPPVQLASTQSAAPPIDDQLLDLLSWDDTREFQQVHHMIDVVQSRGRDIEWDEPAVPLELLPEARPTPRSGVRQAGWRDRP